MDRPTQPGLDQAVAACELVPQGQVLANSSLKHGDPFVDVSHRVDEQLAGNLGDGLPVVQDRPAPGLVEPHDQPGERRLAASRTADERDPLSRLDQQREILDQRFLHGPVVTENHIAKLKPP